MLVRREISALERAPSLFNNSTMSFLFLSPQVSGVDTCFNDNPPLIYLIRFIKYITHVIAVNNFFRLFHLFSGYRIRE